MGILESQLTTWSNQGATTSSASTYDSIKNALDKHTWPTGLKYAVYLQGSYPNNTNIRGNSDVDIVVELISAFYTDVPEAQWSQYGISKAAHGYDDLRREVINALQEYYGTAFVDTSGPNAISVAASGSRLKADVLPSVTYREYKGSSSYAEGIKFWNQATKQEKVNFPKIHIANGQTKNQNGTSGRFKPCVRMMKNAREQIIGSDELLRKKYPSYFIECLLFNAPDDRFATTRQDTYVNLANFFSKALGDGSGARFTTQSRRRLLFGPEPTQWSLTNAQAFVSDLITLWNNS